MSKYEHFKGLDAWWSKAITIGRRPTDLVDYLTYASPVMLVGFVALVHMWNCETFIHQDFSGGSMREYGENKMKDRTGKRCFYYSLVSFHFHA